MKKGTQKLAEGFVLDGKYRIQRVLGRGGMGVVYAAEHVRVRRAVAIKVLEQQVLPEMLVRFEREAQAAGRIGSDHILEVLDLGTTPDGCPFMVMELLEGQTLKERMRAGRPPVERLVHVFKQILEALGAAHKAGIVHRDLKPDNVFLQREKAGHTDWVKIIDFGISKFSAIGDDGHSTRDGVVMGTPFYMSPEQAQAAHTVDARSDLYSIGIMLFEVLTGQVPFRATTFSELLFKIVFEPQPHPRQFNPTLDDGLAAIVIRGMQRAPERRFQTAEEFRQALVEWETLQASGQVMLPERALELSGGGVDRGASGDVAQPPPPPPPPPPPISQATVPARGELASGSFRDLAAEPARASNPTEGTWQGSTSAVGLPTRPARAWLVGVGAAGLLAAGLAAFFVLRPDAPRAAAAAADTVVAAASVAPPAPPAAPTTLPSAVASADPAPTTPPPEASDAHLPAPARSGARPPAARPAKAKPAASGPAATASAAPRSKVPTDYGY